MKKQNLKRIIIAGLIATGILTIAPVSAKAEYTPNTTSLWHAEGTSLIMILKLINEKSNHFDNNTASPQN
jgi:hypothetical protein